MSCKRKNNYSAYKMQRNFATTWIRKQRSVLKNNLIKKNNKKEIVSLYYDTDEYTIQFFFWLIQSQAGGYVSKGILQIAEQFSTFFTRKTRSLLPTLDRTQKSGQLL